MELQILELINKEFDVLHKEILKEDFEPIYDHYTKTSEYSDKDIAEALQKLKERLEDRKEEYSMLYEHVDNELNLGYELTELLFNKVLDKYLGNNCKVAA